VRRKEDQLQYQDASSKYGLGGHVPTHQVYWQLAWTDFGPAVANWIKTTLNQGHNDDTHINWLEYLANFFGLALAAILEKEQPTPCPLLLYQTGDNTTANKAAAKGTARTDSKITAAVCRLRSTLQQETEIATHTGKVPTKDNEFADDLSRAPFDQQREKFFKMSAHTLKTYLFQEYDTTALRTSYRRWIPPPALISIVSSVLLKPRDLALSQSAIAKHLVPKFHECNILTNLLAQYSNSKTPPSIHLP
jgi:hypothetical protein